MIDILGRDINIGDKVAFLPHQEWKPQQMQYGIVVRMTHENGSCYCKSLNDNNHKFYELLRHSHQIIKIN